MCISIYEFMHSPFHKLPGGSRPTVMQHIRFGTSANNVSCVPCGWPERFAIWRTQYTFNIFNSNSTYETAFEINHLEQYQEILGDFLKFFHIWHLLCSLVIQCSQKVTGEIGVRFLDFQTFWRSSIPLFYGHPCHFRHCLVKL